MSNFDLRPQRKAAWGAARAEDRKRMRKVKSRDTSPELVVRRLIHSLGYGYRLHVRDLPGNPDLVFLGRRCVIFVHGCFWHRHRCRRGQSMPGSNRELWHEKFAKTIARDRRVRRALKDQDWRVLVLWECQIDRWNRENLAARIRQFLDA